ncbi:zinc ribbon domain-containing protein [Chloroflexota bacterium]
MAIIRQLYQLQEMDLEIDTDDQALAQAKGRLGKNRAVIEAINALTAEQQKLDDLKRQQRDVERDIDTLSAKIKDAEGQLYGGKITNPKELSSLQHEIETLKARRDQVETGGLEIIDGLEQTEAGVAARQDELTKLEKAWQDEQRRLAVDIAALGSKLSELGEQRQQLAAGVDTATLAMYERLRTQKKQAVAVVEQGTCRGCRISLSYNEIQQAKSGHLVQCNSCGRILYLP